MLKFEPEPFFEPSCFEPFLVSERPVLEEYT